MNKKSVDINRIDLARLKQLLKYGDAPKIAKISGYSLPTVYKVLDPKNKRKNKAIIQAAIKVIEEYKPLEVEVAPELEKEIIKKEALV